MFLFYPKEMSETPSCFPVVVSRSVETTPSRIFGVILIQYEMGRLYCGGFDRGCKSGLAASTKSWLE